MQLGIDISIWQGNMDFAKAVESGAKFCIIRSGAVSKSGYPYEDYKFRSNYKNAIKYFDTLGTYWFFRPEHSVTSQASFMVSLLKDVNFKGEVFLDVEYNAKGIGKETFRNKIHKFMDILKVYGYKDLGIYTRGIFWNSNIGSGDFSNYKLWIARYTTRNHPWNDNPKLFKPLGWNTWHYWQFSADGNSRGKEFGAESNDIDLNYKNTPKHECQKYRVVANRLKIRNGPGTNYRQVGILDKDTVVTAIDTAYDFNNNLWANIGYKQWCAINYNSTTLMIKES